MWKLESPCWAPFSTIRLSRKASGAPAPVEAEPERWTILATFETGERRRYDVGPLLGRGVFRSIATPDAFAALGVDEMGGVTWAAGPDLSRDTVYLASTPA